MTTLAQRWPNVGKYALEQRWHIAAMTLVYQRWPNVGPA